MSTFDTPIDAVSTEVSSTVKLEIPHRDGHFAVIA